MKLSACRPMRFPRPALVPMMAIVLWTAFSGRAPATGYFFNSDTLHIENFDGDPISASGVEGVVPVLQTGSKPGLDTPDAVEFLFPDSLSFSGDDFIYFRGLKPVRIIVQGDITIPAGMFIEASGRIDAQAAEPGTYRRTNGGGGRGGPGLQSGGDGGTGGAGGPGGTGGDPGDGGTVITFGGGLSGFIEGVNGTGGTGGVGTTGKKGSPGNPGHYGLQRDGEFGFGAPDSGGLADDSAVPGGPGGKVGKVGSAPGDGGLGGPWGGATHEEKEPGSDGDHGQDLKSSAGRKGSKGAAGGGGVGGKYMNPQRILIGGGGGSSGAGGGGGGGGSGGAGGSGGGGGGGGGAFYEPPNYIAPASGLDGGMGGAGGNGGTGGTGGEGTEGADGGNGGGAFELNATGTIVIGGTLRANGEDGDAADLSTYLGQAGEYGDPGADGAAGEVLEDPSGGVVPDWELFAPKGGSGGDGSDGGIGGIGGTGGAGGPGGGGAGGTIILQAAGGIQKLFTAVVEAKGGAGGGPDAGDGEDGLVIEVGPRTIGTEPFDYPHGWSLHGSAGGPNGTGFDWDNFGHVATGTFADWDLDHITSPIVFEGALLTATNLIISREYNGPTEGVAVGTDERSGAFRGTGTVYYKVELKQWGSTGASLMKSLDFTDERVTFGIFYLSGIDGPSEFGIEGVAVPRVLSGITPVANRSYIVVAKIDYDADLLSLWLDPDLGQPEEANNPIATAPFTETNWSTAVQFSSDVSTLWDDLVVANDWTALAVTVTSLTDEDDGSLQPLAGSGNGVSLREALLYAPSGSTIVFAPELAGGTLELSSKLPTIDRCLTIDGSTRGEGITIDAGAVGTSTSRRVFTIASGVPRVVLESLTLTGGNALPEYPEILGKGGAILSDADLLVVRNSTITGNNAQDQGGAIEHSKPVELYNTTITANTAPGGGGIHSSYTSLELHNSTIAANEGGINGGGVFLDNTTLELSNSIIALNESSSAKDLHNSGTVNLSGVNIISDLAGSSLSASAALLETDPLLAPLANYGGPVRTMHPLSGSPAIDPAGGSTGSILGGDARGFPRIVASDPAATPTPIVDIGAVEVGPIRVVTTSADENDGVGVGAVSLREAVDAASPGQIIRFDSAVFNPSNTRLLLDDGMGPLTVNTSVFIDGTGLLLPLTIDGGGEARILTIQAGGSATLSGMTLTGGRAGLGGAIMVNTTGALTLDGMVLRENTADQKGGAIFSRDGDIRIRRTTITGNRAEFNGGGIACQGGSLQLMDTTFSRNRAGRGGALHLGSGTAVATNCTVAENVAEIGGGIAGETTEAGSLHLVNTTVARNRADTEGGGIHLTEGQAANLDNMIVAANEAPSGPDLMVGGGGPADASNLQNLIGNNDGSGIAASSLVGTPGSPVDPMLSLLGFFGGPVQTLHPLVGSPAIHGGSVSYDFSPPRDARGFDRVVPEEGSISILLDIDLGAVEAGEAIVVDTAADEDDGAETGGVSLRDAIAAVNSPNDRVVFDPAIFTGGAANLLTLAHGQLVANEGMFLDASNIPDGITIDANGVMTGHRVLEVTSGDFAVAMDSFTMTGGSGSFSDGGAIKSAAADFTLLRSRVTGNEAGISGGGIAAFASRIALEGVLLDANEAIQGGGIACGRGEIFNSTISGNHATGVGGGLFGGDRLLVANSTISGNTTVDEGGGIYPTGRIRFGNATIAGNTSNSWGGGIFNPGVSTVELTNSIVAANTAPGSPDIANSGGTVIPGGANLIGNNSSVETEFPTGPLAGAPGNEIDPLLSALADLGGSIPTRHPLGGSPAIDPDSSATRLLITDARGFGDEANGAVDLGAVETDQVIPGFAPVVDTSTDGSDGLFGTNQTSLREAIAFAPEGSTITFDAALSGQTLALVDSELIIAKDLTLDASALSGGFTIKAAPDQRVLHIPGSDSQVVLVSLALTGGNPAGEGSSPARGGAISNAGVLILTDVTVSGNVASSGGGIYNSGSLTLNESRIENNRATGFGGGGIHSSEPEAQLSIEGTMIANNSAPTGGGISMFGGSLFQIKDSTLFNNAARLEGGGIFAFSIGGVIFANTTLTRNTATDGAGLWLSGSLTMTNTTVARNAAAGAGGGIYLSGSADLTLGNSIVAGNTAGLGGADFLKDGDGVTVSPSGLNLIGSNETVDDVLPTGPLVGAPGSEIDPRLSPLSDFGGPVLTLHPLADSLAIDPTGGASTSLLSADARGRPRLIDGDAPIDGSVVLDLGAVEAGPTIQVTTQNDENDGIGVQGISLREALDEVADFGVVRFVPALFNGEPSDTIHLDPAFGHFNVSKSVFIDASNIPGGVTLDADGSTQDHRIFQVNDPSTRFVADSLTLTGGNVPDYAGALWANNFARVTLNRCTVTGNHSDGIAGGISAGGYVVLNGSTVSANTSFSDGGGIYVFVDLEAHESTIEGNQSFHDGGGILNSGNTSLEHSTLSGNIALNNGGAVLNLSQRIICDSSTFTGNVAARGGALSLGGTCRVTNATFTGNTAQTGGAIDLTGGSLELSFSTVAGNTAASQGGGIFLRESPAGTLEISNSIVAGNHSPDSADVRFDGGSITPRGKNLIGSNQSVETTFPAGPLAGTPGAPLDPKLNPPGDNGGPVPTMTPKTASAAVDPTGGDTTAEPPLDARGGARVADGDAVAGAIADLGAVELGARLVVTTLQDQNDSYLVNGASLREALAVADGLVNTIVFDPSVFNGTGPEANHILLTEGEIEVDKPVVIDASGIPSGISIDGGGSNRILRVLSGGDLSLDTVSLTGGLASSQFGAAILNFGSVSLRNGTVHDNSASVGGGIYNYGTLELENATFFGNSAVVAGGAVQCTGGSVLANHVTIAGNTVSSQMGGGIRLYQGASLEISNSIVAGNTASTGPDISIQTPGVETVTALGRNLIGNNDLVATIFPEDGIFVGGGSLPPVHPMLAPPGDYDGSSLTMPPLPGSSAIEGALLLASTPAFDQRGAARPGITGTPDLGAVEARAFSSLATDDADGDGIADLLEGPGGPFAHLTPGVDDSSVDTDGDGSTDAEEIANMTDLFDSNDLLRIASFQQTGDDGEGNLTFQLSFPSFPGLFYSVEVDDQLEFSSPQVSDLGSATGFSMETTITLPQGDSSFIRVRRD